MQQQCWSAKVAQTTAQSDSSASHQTDSACESAGVMQNAAAAAAGVRDAAAKEKRQRLGKGGELEEAAGEDGTPAPAAVEPDSDDLDEVCQGAPAGVGHELLNYMAAQEPRQLQQQQQHLQVSTMVTLSRILKISIQQQGAPASRSLT
jgi:hypothetical protein